VADGQVYGGCPVTDGQPQRPNAKYKLSKPDTNVNTEENLTFYYNRERRLAKAPQAVRELYKDIEKKNYNRFNLLRPLIADKPRAFVFASIVILCAAIVLLSVLGYMGKSYSMEGNKLTISATGYEGAAIVVLKKSVNNKKSSYSGAVDIAVSPVVQNMDEQYPVFYHRVFFTLEPEEEYRFVVPFDPPDIAVVLQTEKSALKITVKVD
jgi:hypothetical protein